MNEKKWKQIQWNEMIYRILYAVILLCMVLFGAGKWCGIIEPSFVHVLVGIVTLAILLLLNFSKLRGRLFCVIGICAVGAVIVVFVTPAEVMAFISHYFEWLVGSTGWITEQELAYELIQTILIALICYLLQILLERLPMVRYAVAVVLLAGLLVCMFMEQKLSHMGAVFIIWYVVLGYIEWTKIYWKKEKSGDRKSYMVWMMPFCILYLFIFSILPSFSKPYDWKLVKNLYGNLKESVTAMVENITNGDIEDFGVNFAGFSEEGDLRGNVIDTKQQIMTVQGTKNLKTNVYLTGKVYDTFDGKSWTNETAPYPNERMLDTLETMYAIWLYEGNQTDFVSEGKLKIRYRFFQSGYLFAPMKSFALNCDKNYTQDMAIKFQKKQGYGTEYEVSFLQMNLDQPSLYEYMEMQPPEDRKLWDTLVTNNIPKNEHRPTWEELQEHRNLIYQNDIGEIHLTEKTQTALEQMTEGETTSIGKLRAIERELSSYTYTRTPGVIPPSVKSDADFLDYFLEKKEGYCSYFATAFVLLARAEGIPARYVEGFSVATKADQEISVYSGSSHAWPEVYIDGFGWIPFEPTPGYAEIRYTPWKTAGATSIVTSGKPYGYGEEAATAEEIDEAKMQEDDPVYEMQKTVRLFKIIGITLGILVILISVFFVIDKAIRRIRYRHMNQTDQFVVEVKRNLWLLSKMKIERNPSETLQELKKRSKKILPETELYFLDDYEDYLYGSHEITQTVLQDAITQQNELLKLLKSKRRWYYYRVRLFL